MKTTEKYLNGLKEAYLKDYTEEEREDWGDEDIGEALKEQWEYFEKNKHGASGQDIAALKALYPQIPNALIELLEYADGTYWRKYGKEKVALLVLGSDIEEYGYYLLSSKEMVKNRNVAAKYYSGYINREFEADGVKMDDRIIGDSAAVKWLHFSDCMNNGGTSQLFVDFTPSEKGKVGQIVRFLHDPDSFKVIAGSFDEYLEMLMKNGYDFVGV